MTRYLTSGSAFERMAICPASVALPHADYESEWASRGTMIHEFLENVSRVGRDEALDLVVDDGDRRVCDALVLEGLDEQLSLAAEVALAYDFETDTARELGRGEGRKYDDVLESELPTTLDVVGERRVPAGRRGLVVDWKTGWTTRKRIETVTQLQVGALAAARAFDFDIVEVQLIHVHEDIDPWVQRQVYEGWELDAFASYARDIYTRALELREQMRMGVLPTEWNTGPWCERCPAREWCDAHTRQLRALLQRDLFDGEMRMQNLPDESLVSLWHRLHEAESDLAYLKRKIYGVAANRTLYLGRDPKEDKDRWLGKVRYQGNEKLDGEIVFDVVAELHGEDVATKATKVITSKEQLDAAIKGAVKRGEKASALREIYKRVSSAGGSRREWKEDVKEYRTKPVADTAPKELTDGRATDTTDEAE